MTRIVPSIGVAICMMSPASVRADSITITSGSVALVSVRGSDGLRGTLNGDAFSMSFSWGGAVILPCPCQAGDAVTLSSSAHAPNTLNTEGLDNDAMGTAIIGGTLYTGLAFVGDLTFAGPTFTLPALPPVDPGTFPIPLLLSGPFAMSGTISGYYVLGRDPQLRFTTDLSGTGTVNARLLGGPGQRYELNELRYDFAPVPEPGTLLLVGGGLAAAWGRSRRGRPNRLRH